MRHESKIIFTAVLGVLVESCWWYEEMKQTVWNRSDAEAKSGLSRTRSRRLPLSRLFVPGWSKIIVRFCLARVFLYIAFLLD